MSIVFIQFLLAHFIGDFVVQPSKWVADKEKKGIKSLYLWLHILIHIVLMLVLTGFKTSLLPIIIIIGISHLLIDWLKIRLKKYDFPFSLFVADQVAHIAIIIGLIIWHLQLSSLAWQSIYHQVLLIALALVLTIYVSGIIMQLFLSRWKVDENTDEALYKAGWYIGVLERLFIVGFVLSDYWAGIGFMIAAKSIFRFSDLSRAKDRKLTEYVLIGTLLSYGLAFCTALLIIALWKGL